MNSAGLAMIEAESFDQVKGKSVYPLVAEEYREAFRDMLGEVFSGISRILEFRMVGLKGRSLWLSTHVVPMCDEAGGITSALAITVDISDQKRHEELLLRYHEQLRSLASQLSVAEEHERRRFAEALHDRVGQMLAVLNIKAGLLEGATATGERTHVLHDIRSIVAQCIQETRALTFELSPPVLRELGLTASLEWLAEHFHENYGLPVSVNGRIGDDRLGEEVKYFLFRSAQELLFNVLKHAGASSARLTMADDGERLRVMVEDFGVGFNPEAALDAGGHDAGFGLFSIRERVKYYGGSLLIDSRPGGCTKVEVTVPPAANG